jgi:hypothetical protein
LVQLTAASARWAARREDMEISDSGRARVTRKRVSAWVPNCQQFPGRWPPQLQETGGVAMCLAQLLSRSRGVGVQGRREIEDQEMLSESFLPFLAVNEKD